MGRADGARPFTRSEKSMRSNGRLVLAFGLLVSFAVGCLNRDLQPLDPCVVSGVRKERIFTVEKVDLLFVVDNSDSMAGEQRSLREQFPRMMEVLTSGDLDLDGTAEFPGVKSLRVGVVSTDMGDDNESDGRSCDDLDGDDGILLDSGNGGPGCARQYPRFLEYDPELDTPAGFAADFACMANLGVGGCGYEQQLEAGLKALTPSTSDLEFRFGSLTTRGHGDVENCCSGRDCPPGFEGNAFCFAREDSLLAVIIVSDEEDCSTSEAALFEQPSFTYDAPVNLKCWRFENVLHATQRYVDGFLALRGSPDLLVFGAIVGVPPDLVRNPDAVDYDTILSDRRMQYVPTKRWFRGNLLDSLTPSCERDVAGEIEPVTADPPRRIVTVAKDLEAAGANTVVQSICQDDFTGALDAIIEKIAEVLRGTCLPRPLNPDASGRVNCSVVEILAPDGDYTSCDELVDIGREPDPIRFEDGRPVCRINQVVPDRSSRTPTLPEGERGWYYDDFSADIETSCGEGMGQRLSFTRGAEPKAGSEIRLECLQTVLTKGAALNPEPGSPCGAEDQGDAFCGGSDSVIPGMICDELTNTCQISCEANTDCGGALVCDSARGGQTLEGGQALRPICVNPACSG